MALSLIGVALLGLLVLCWLALRAPVRSGLHNDEPVMTVTLLRDRLQTKALRYSE
jgi:hypothetical protein